MHFTGIIVVCVKWKCMEFYFSMTGAAAGRRLQPHRDEEEGKEDDGTNSLRISLASSMLFLASFSARRALTLSKPSAISRLKLWSIVPPVTAESALDVTLIDVTLTGAWCLAGNGGTDPSGKLTLWPEDRSLDAFLPQVHANNNIHRMV